MSSHEDREILLADLNRLHDKGSGESVLESCHSIRSLPPVRLAIDRGAPPGTAVLTLLQSACGNSEHSHREYVVIATALTGINPRHIGRGVPFDPGADRRQQNAAELAGKKSTRSFRGSNREFYLQEYVTAILAYVRILERDSTRMVKFVHKCGVVADSPLFHGAVSAQPGPATGDLVAYPIQLAGQLRRDLDAALARCETRGRRFYTSDMLLTLLDTPNSQVVKCFDKVEEGLGKKLRLKLYDLCSSMETVDIFVFYEWEEREEDVIPAWHYAPE